MKQAVLSQWDLPLLTVSALIIFVVTFSVYTWWTFKKSNKSLYEDLSKMPLDDKDMI